MSIRDQSEQLPTKSGHYNKGYMMHQLILRNPTLPNSRKFTDRTYFSKPVEAKGWFSLPVRSKHKHSQYFMVPQQNHTDAKSIEELSKKRLKFISTVLKTCKYHVKSPFCACFDLVVFKICSLTLLLVFHV